VNALVLYGRSSVRPSQNVGGFLIFIRSTNRLLRSTRLAPPDAALLLLLSWSLYFSCTAERKQAVILTLASIKPNSTYNPVSVKLPQIECHRY
jgi:hypothetical protein